MTHTIYTVELIQIMSYGLLNIIYQMDYLNHMVKNCITKCYKLTDYYKLKIKIHLKK